MCTLPQTAQNLFDVIALETEGILICGGDFNMSMNPNLQRKIKNIG